MNRTRLWIAALVLACAPAQAEESDREARYRNLLYELRCLVCQNQSLADSDAELAGDLRARVRALIDQGLSDEETLAHLQARYGDFILYRPPLSVRTLALWLGPFALLALVAGILLWRIRRIHACPAQGLSEQERARLDALTRRRPD